MYDISMLPDWLQSSDDEEEEFYGFALDENNPGDDPTVSGKLSNKWYQIFGDHESKLENSFEGFQIDEV